MFQCEDLEYKLQEKDQLYLIKESELQVVERHASHSQDLMHEKLTEIQNLKEVYKPEIRPSFC